MKRVLKHPLVMLAVVVAVVLTALHFVPDEHLSDWVDAPIVSWLSIGYLIAAGTMVGRTGWPRWTVLSAGMLATFLGDAIYWGLVVYLKFFGAFPHFVILVYLVRALFFAGSTFVVIGLVREWWGERQEKKQAERDELGMRSIP